MPFRINTAGPGFGSALLLISITSTQIGSSFAKFLFELVGPEAAVALRLLTSTFLLFVALRPWRHVPKGSEWKSVALYGLSIAVMNACFYLAISRIPLGIAVAIEFSGPLLVAATSSRRAIDFAAVALAAAGLLTLRPWAGVNADLDMTGVFFAALAAVFWGTYIIVGRRAGTQAGASASAWGGLVGTMAAVPWALCMTGGVLVPEAALADAIPLAFLVGFLASALPYGLEIVSLRLVPPQVFGVLMSLEPAVATLFGFLILGEALQLSQLAAIGMVSAASLLVTMKRRNS
jgi:inner membrane transporter RhtA